MEHNIGDFVIAKTKNIFGKAKEVPEGITEGKAYKILNIHRCIDGAYSWDDLFLDGLGNRKFCEFDFEKENNHEHR